MSIHPHAHGAHDHPHPHGHARDHGDARRRLTIALALTAVFLVAEVVGGLLSNSLALLADAGHMLTDAGALALSLFVAWISRRPATPEKTYGYWRWEILAALINGAALLVVSGTIVWEAFQRLRTPEPIASGVMLAVAAAGLLVNVGSAWVLHPSSETSLNLRGAYLHVLADLLGSVATVGAALAVRLTGWLLADPIASILVTLLVVRGAWHLVRESVNVLLDYTPAHIPAASVRTQLEAIPGIEAVHDLHVWTVTSGVVAMSAHAIVRDPARHQHVLEHVHDAMRLFGIEHVTVQLESREMYEREKHLHP
ncbi:MAG TPA: cation diffusion facilitator family transporter [Gemmatimonadaceae bacterium]|nr:cation diffusion facilitator family transporter [Gemmatimonadaceae bacterium]